MANENFGLIMAGGQGTRFWPLSTAEKPKQFLSIVGGKPLIYQTYLRLAEFIEPEKIYVVADGRYLARIQEAIPGFNPANLIDEPVPRNTAPSLILANIFLSARSPSARVLVVPADHYITDLQTFAAQMKDALDYAKNRTIVTAGIPPTHAHTGYGYVRFDSADSSRNGEVDFFPVLEFREKPEIDQARKYVEAGTYFWNSGMFAYKLSHFKDFLQKYAPYYFARYEELEMNFGDPGKFAEIFARIRPQSIDFALMEKVREATMFGAQFDWNDVGAWPSVYELSDKDSAGNVCRPEQMMIDSENCLVFSSGKKPVALIGMKDVAVVETDNGILVGKMAELQKVKRVIEKLAEKK